jgi:hypothetical protein
MSVGPLPPVAAYLVLLDTGQLVGCCCDQGKAFDWAYEVNGAVLMAPIVADFRTANPQAGVDASGAQAIQQPDHSDLHRPREAGCASAG